MSGPTFQIIDLEVENHEHCGDLASPHHELNYIVAPAFALDLGPVSHWYFENREQADASDWFQIPDSVQYLVAHNATFELCWLMHRHWDTLMAFLKRGGKVLCTQLAEYLLSHQTLLYPTLDETAVKYGGTEKIDAVKLLWDQGVKTSQIDKALLTEYLAGPEGDIVNTRLAIFGQIPLLQQNGMWEMYLMRCDSLLYCAFAKFFGDFVDLDKAAESKAFIEAHVQKTTAALAAYLPQDLPAPDQFNWGSDYHVSALLFGGPIKFDVKVPYDPPAFEKMDAYNTTGGYVPVEGISLEELEQRLFMSGHELVRYKSGKNKGLPKVERVDSTTPKLKWGIAVYKFPGLIPLSSLPADVSKQFTDERGEFRGKRYLSDREVVMNADKTAVLQVVVPGTPVYSTSGEALELVGTHSGNPITALLTDLADHLKILGTYFEGLMKNVDDKGILRAPTNNVSTITGRLSSKLQQMPRVELVEGSDPKNKEYTVGSHVKAMLCSRFPNGKRVGVDYTALEVVHLAALSGDKELLKALQSGTDMHILRLSAKLGRPYQELLDILHNKEHPEHASIKQQRQDVKPQAFQYQYGGTAQGIAYKIKGVTVEAAQAFIDNENKLFPESSQYRHVIEREVEERAMTLPYSREMKPDGVTWGLYKRSYSIGPSGTRYSYRTYTKFVYENGKKTEINVFKLPQLANYQNQGEAALVTQVSCGLIIRWLISQDFYKMQVLPTGTVHDANYLDTADGFAVPVAKYTAQLMEYAPKYMAERLPAYRHLSEIPYPAVPEIGPNLKDLEHLEEA